MFYYEVAVSKRHSGNKLFTYSWPSKLEIGKVVKVNFGKTINWAVILAIVKKPTFRVKQIQSVSDLLLPEKSIKLLKWMIDFYPEDYGVITRQLLPVSLIKGREKSRLKIIYGQNKELPNPTADQNKALKQIDTSKSKRILLHGDTGTGKTRVFLDLVKATVKDGKSAMILTPEIGLTPQLVEDLKTYVNGPIVLTHSQLTNVKRRQIWQYAMNETSPTIYVGPRSALFLPIKDLGLIVIDEAHDSSYKQQQSPKYFALNVAGKIAEIHGCRLVQSTATPNIEDYQNALRNKYLIVRMKEKAAGDKSSKINVIDLTDRSYFNRSSYLADQVLDSIQKALDDNKQVMLFLNRRGSARVVQCKNCGWQIKCPYCDLPLIYHHDKHSVVCHACRYHEKAPYKCKICSSIEIIYKTIGTKGLTEHVANLFPEARVRRFDQDSEKNERYHLKIQDIKNGLVDLIIGTQLITKGIDLPDLSVVVIVDADSGLNIPDYRSEETAFQQVYQASGRAIRGHTKSEVFIQTRLSSHPLLAAIKKRSWESFYSKELPKRQSFNYPPYCYIAIYKVYKKSTQLGQTKALHLADSLRKLPDVEVLGPSPAFYEKTKAGFGWQIIVKAKKRKLLVDIARSMPGEWSINIDPASLL